MRDRLIESNDESPTRDGDQVSQLRSVKQRESGRGKRGYRSACDEGIPRKQPD